MLESKWLLAVLKFIHAYYGLLFVAFLFAFGAAVLLLRRPAPAAKAAGVLLMLLPAAYAYLGVVGFDALTVRISQQGARGELVLSRVEPSSLVVNKRRLNNFVGFLKRQGSEELHPIEFLEGEFMEWPEVEGFAPRIGKTYTVRFAEAYPAFFVFDHGGEEGAALVRECYARSRSHADLVARATLAPQDAALQRQVQENGQFLTGQCGSVF